MEKVTVLEFQPEDVRLPVPFRIHADSIPEDSQREIFTLFLSINESKAGLRISNSSTVINILDDDSKCSSLKSSNLFLL